MATYDYEVLNKWDKRFLSLAEHISAWSKDPSTKCGAVITKGNRIVSLGFNGFPMGVIDHTASYHNRDLKYEMILHAEVNAITFSKEPLSNCTIYTWPFQPCCRCASQIIQNGIKKVIAPQCTDKILELRWKESMEISQQMYKDADVFLIEVAVLNNSTQE